MRTNYVVYGVPLFLVLIVFIFLFRMSNFLLLWIFPSVLALILSFLVMKIPLVNTILNREDKPILSYAMGLFVGLIVFLVVIALFLVLLVTAFRGAR